MGRTIELLRREPRARLFFAVLTQSALGTGAGYVALLIIAYDRFNSAWAISLVLIAELIPAMALGPVFGAAADRWSRRACLVAADLARAGAFAGIALVESFEATLALALLAGVGTGLFTPAALSALPTLVAKARLPAATSLYGAIADLGFTAGPALAAGLLVLGGADAIMVANAVTFAVSATVLGRLSFGALAPPEAPAAGAGGGRPSLLREAREGVRATAAMAGVRVVVLATGAALFIAGVFNVAELPFATDVLGTSDAGFSVLVAGFGLGFIAGSLSGSAGGTLARLKRGYLTGLLLVALGLVATGLAPGFAAALGAFALAGFGNGAVLVYERLLIQTTVPSALMGRVFGIKDGLTAWAFALAFLAAGALVSALGVRTMLLAAGLAGVLVWLGSVVALRGAWAGGGPPSGGPWARPIVERTAAGLGGGADALWQRPSGQHGPHLVDGRDHWLALLDDLDQGGDDTGVELRPRVGP